MAARISEDGVIEIEFYLMKLRDGSVKVWTIDPPPIAPYIEVSGPFIASGRVEQKFTPAKPPANNTLYLRTFDGRM